MFPATLGEVEEEEAADGGQAALARNANDGGEATGGTTEVTVPEPGTVEEATTSGLAEGRSDELKHG